jgi:Zn-dependent M28 family amino/carboxypeptidase
MIDIRETSERLRQHLQMLTVTIGERSIYRPDNLERARAYIESFYQDLGLAVENQPYAYENLTVGNVITQIDSGDAPSRRYLLGAHYDSVIGTVGADDNAAAIAVQLETARRLKEIAGTRKLNAAVKFVSFVLEEPPAFATRHMGSKVYARKARSEGESFDGMICLEMVGYFCDEPGCQRYPFPLMFMNYPKAGNFIGIVGNSRSKELTRSLEGAFRSNPALPVVTLTVPLNGWVLPSVRLSDHSAFWDEGYRAVMVTDSAFFRNPHYHLPSDTMNTLDFRRMAELVESLLIFFGP